MRSRRPRLAARRQPRSRPAAAVTRNRPCRRRRPGWMLGLGAQADENDAHSVLGTSYIGVGPRTWLTFSAGKSSSPGDGGDIEANALLIGVDHRFDKVGFTFEVEQWGDSGVLETTDFSGSVYFDRVRWRIGFGYEQRDIEIPFTLTGPFGGTLQRYRRRAGRRPLARRQREPRRALAVVRRSQGVRLRAQSQRAAADRELELAQHVDVDAREQLSRPRPLAQRRAQVRPGDVVERAIRHRRSAIDGAELDTLEAAVLFPIGRRIDLEVNLGRGRSVVLRRRRVRRTIVPDLRTLTSASAVLIAASRSSCSA